MRSLFIDNDGGGFSDGIDAAEGATVARHFAGRMPGREAGDHPTRIHPSPAGAEPALQPDDLVSFIPRRSKAPPHSPTSMRARPTRAAGSRRFRMAAMRPLPQLLQLATRLQAAWAARDEPHGEFDPPPLSFDGCSA